MSRGARHSDPSPEHLSRRDIVRIARRFNAGDAETACRSPEGTAEPTSMMSSVSRPFGAGPFGAALPGVETPGYSHLSLRDKTANNAATPGQGRPYRNLGRKPGVRCCGRRCAGSSTHPQILRSVDKWFPEPMLYRASRVFAPAQGTRSNSCRPRALTRRVFCRRVWFLNA